MFPPQPHSSGAPNQPEEGARVEKKLGTILLLSKPEEPRSAMEKYTHSVRAERGLGSCGDIAKAAMKGRGTEAKRRQEPTFTVCLLCRLWASPCRERTVPLASLGPAVGTDHCPPSTRELLTEKRALRENEGMCRDHCIFHRFIVMRMWRKRNLVRCWWKCKLIQP